jgi:hypothetical protein
MFGEVLPCAVGFVVAGFVVVLSVAVGFVVGFVVGYNETDWC